MFLVKLILKHFSDWDLSGLGEQKTPLSVRLLFASYVLLELVLSYLCSKRLYSKKICC